MTKRALVIGASGMVGAQLVRQLLEDPDYGQVTSLVRKPLVLSHPKLNQVMVDFERLEEHAGKFAADVVFCCLGTTMKKARTRPAFRRVDLEYPVQGARLAVQAGVKQFAVISATGAKETSLFFYNRVKGEMERLLREAGLPVLHIFRPSLLLGERDEHRTGEAAAAAISRSLPILWSGPLRRFKPVEASTVASAMRAAVRQGAQDRHVPAVRVYESEQLAEMGKKCNEANK